MMAERPIPMNDAGFREAWQKFQVGTLTMDDVLRFGEECFRAGWPAA